jgi:hypothetical protein
MKLGNILAFRKRAAIFIHKALLSKASAKIPPFPPFEKRGRMGGLRRRFQKAKYKIRDCEPGTHIAYFPRMSILGEKLNPQEGFRDVPNSYYR